MDTDSPSTPSAAVSPAQPSVSPARIIARRATDLLAISLVLIVGLSAGRQIIAWWRTDAVPSLDAVGLNDPQMEWSRRPLWLQFGESSTSIQRVPFNGSRDAAQQQLIRLARESLHQPPDWSLPASPEEQEWIAALEKLTPAESTADLGNIYLVPGLLPSVAATSNGVSSDRVSGVPPRLIAWGLATPAGENSWTLLMFHPSQAGRQSDPTDPILPADAETLLAWRDAKGNRVISFRGDGRIADWLADFTRQFGAPKSVNRSADDTRAVTRWETSAGQIDVQLSRQDLEISGLLWITAPVQGHNAISQENEH